MATFKPFRAKPWRAQVGRNETYRHLGYYLTKEEAECVEFDYGRRLPKKKCECAKI